MMLASQHAILVCQLRLGKLHSFPRAVILCWEGMVTRVSADYLRAVADQAGLRLSDKEMKRLLRAVARSQTDAAALRGLLEDTCVPAGVFRIEPLEKE